MFYQLNPILNKFYNIMVAAFFKCGFKKKPVVRIIFRYQYIKFFYSIHAIKIFLFMNALSQGKRIYGNYLMLSSERPCETLVLYNLIISFSIRFLKPQK